MELIVDVSHLLVEENIAMLSILYSEMSTSPSEQIAESEEETNRLRCKSWDYGPLHRLLDMFIFLLHLCKHCNKLGQKTG